MPYPAPLAPAGAVADPEAGVEPLPLPESDQKGKGDAASGDKAQPKPPQDAAPDKTAGAEEDLEEDYEDYERKEAEAAREKEEEAEKAAADEKKEAAGKKEAEAEKPATKGEAAQKKDATSAATPTAEGARHYELVLAVELGCPAVQHADVPRCLLQQASTACLCCVQNSAANSPQICHSSPLANMRCSATGWHPGADKAAEGKEQKSEEDEEAKGGGRRLRRASLRR